MIGALVWRLLLGAVFSVLLAALPASAQEVDPLPKAEELQALPADGGTRYNRLVFEQSPYLLQHATNPVDWYPWGEEAFGKAEAEDKPIFLSIGYSTCHWCHVMERESFEDDEVAALLNEHFICIKVDREERPDIDQVYMTASIATRKSGGWPQTVLMAHDKLPFYLASYIPKESRGGRIGLLELLGQVAGLWETDRAFLRDTASENFVKLVELNDTQPGEGLTEALFEKAYLEMSGRFDPAMGGFAVSPKFPPTHHLVFLLHYWRRSQDRHALEMVTTTLDNMRRGGIFDHLGHGFHRYATDSKWNVPHFEKTLYDQAMLALAYATAYQATGKETYAATTREVLDFVLRDMTSPAGAFYSAYDADSEGEEGKYYVWTVEEVRSVLGDEEARLFIDAYGLEEDGNYLDQATHKKTGGNVLHLTENFRFVAGGEIARRLARSRSELLAVRARRIPPTMDDTILLDWNGLTIAALAEAGRVLDDDTYRSAARKAADFLLANMRSTGGGLNHRYRNGASGLPAHLEDYAFFVWGLIELYESTFETRYLREALALNELALERFWDGENGGFLMTAHDAERLPIRPKEAHDRARPSGNSVAALNLLRLARLTGRTELEERADALFRAFSRQVRQVPSAFTQMLIALELAVGPAFEVVISGDPEAGDTKTMLRALNRAFIPNKAVLLRPIGESPMVTELAPFTGPQRALEGKATAYVCENFVCKRPTTKIAEMLALLGARAS